jgi:hypothetical protein
MGARRHFVALPEAVQTQRTDSALSVRRHGRRYAAQSRLLCVRYLERVRRATLTTHRARPPVRHQGGPHPVSVRSRRVFLAGMTSVPTTICTAPWYPITPPSRMSPAGPHPGPPWRRTTAPRHAVPGRTFPATWPRPAPPPRRSLAGSPSRRDPGHRRARA